MAKRPARANRMGALVLALGLMTGIGACSPVHTLDIFDPSDGVRVTLDSDLKGSNLLLLTEAQGAPGTLVGSLTNTTTGALQVEITVGGAAPISLDLEAGQTVYLTPRDVDFDGSSFAFDAQVDSVDVAPGGTASVTVATASGGSTVVEVPVLDGTLEPYDQYLP